MGMFVASGSPQHESACVGVITDEKVSREVEKKLDALKRLIGSNEKLLRELRLMKAVAKNKTYSELTEKVFLRLLNCVLL